MAAPKQKAQDTRTALSLKSLYLDPNNYRIIDAEVYERVPADRLTEPDVQRRTNNLILGKNAENVRDLIESFKVNGFLPVDQIQVRRLDDSSRFLVVEGNRRVATLKHLQARYEQEALDLGRLDAGLFSRVPVVSYTDPDPGHHLVLMGLKHISGNKKWPAINQAQLIREYHEDYGKSLDEIAKALGITRQETQAILETLALINAYRSSVYGDQFESSKYSIFREVIRSPKLRSWLRWNGDTKVAASTDNLSRLFSWVSQEIVVDDDDEADAGEITQTQEAIIGQSRQIRELAKIIGDKDALEELEATRSFSDAALSSKVLGKDSVKKALGYIDRNTTRVFERSEYLDEQDRENIERYIGKLESLVGLDKTQSVSAASRQGYLSEDSPDKFSQITIQRFRGLRDTSLHGLKSINVVAGLNNSGKTTVLEAVRLLCSLTSTRDYLSLVKTRAKIPERDGVDIGWLLEQLAEVSLSAAFAGAELSLQVELKEQPPDTMAQYLRSACLAAAFGNEQYSSRLHFYEGYRARVDGEDRSLCPSVFATPFSTLDPVLLKECLKASLRESSKEAVIQFLQEHVDKNIVSIELDDREHFIVSHKSIKPSPDLTMFGDGLQRIFKIGLLFAGAKGGVVVIDEFENAIHATLLPELATLVHQMADRFKVQVFICSHSKECIDAFSDRVPEEDISFHGFIEHRDKDAPVCEHFAGDKLKRLRNAIDFDLRG